ncbi:MAG: hypothetical protein Q8L69_13540 [Gallionellaceae bacterium]|nr:hypothetical protein [Gallionellaceae bacterium]
MRNRSYANPFDLFENLNMSGQYISKIEVVTCLRHTFYLLLSVFLFALAHPANAKENNNTISAIIESETARPTVHSKSTLEKAHKLLSNEPLEDYEYQFIASNLIAGAEQEAERENYSSAEQKARLVIEYIDLYPDRFSRDDKTIANKAEANLLVWFFSGKDIYHANARKLFLEAETITTSTTVAKNFFDSVYALDINQRVELIQKLTEKTGKPMDDLVVTSTSHAAEQHIGTYNKLVWYGKKQGRPNSELISIVQSGVQAYHEVGSRLPVHKLNGTLYFLLTAAFKNIGDKGESVFIDEFSNLMKKYSEEQQKLRAWQIFHIFAKNERYNEATYWFRLYMQNAKENILVKARKFVTQDSYDERCIDGIRSAVYQKFPAFIKYAEKNPDEFKELNDTTCAARLEVLSDNKQLKAQ